MQFTHSQKWIFALIVYLLFAIPLQVKEPSLYQGWKELFFTCVFICLLYYKKHFKVLREKVKKQMLFPTCVVIFFIFIFLSFGFFVGFQKSPYGHTLVQIVKNFWTLLLPIICIEWIRYFYLLRNAKRKKSVVLLTILLFLVEVNYRTFFQVLLERETLFQWLCSRLIPLFAGHLLFTYITIRCQYTTVLTFRMIYQFVILLVPIFPKLDWFMLGCFELIEITVIYLLFQYQVPKERPVKTLHKKNSLAMINYAFALVFATVFTSFMLGVFQYEPIVILSNSMYPIYKRGDIVIFEKLKTKDFAHLQEGDIIIYQMNGRYIAHRIVKVIESSKRENAYFTKGDMNKDRDSYSVKVQNIVGIFRFSIPWLGYPSVWFNEYFQKEDVKVKVK